VGRIEGAVRYAAAGQEVIARTGETMTTAAMVNYPYDRIDQARGPCRALSRPLMMWAPRAASCSAAARPMPLVLPVISAVWPTKS
jgi:hypothetical protein